MISDVKYTFAFDNLMWSLPTVGSTPTYIGKGNLGKRDPRQSGANEQEEG